MGFKFNQQRKRIFEWGSILGGWHCEICKDILNSFENVPDG